MGRLFPVGAVVGIHPARGHQQEGCGWGAAVGAGAAEDEGAPVAVTTVDGAFSGSPAAPPGQFLRRAPAGGSLPRRLVPVPQVTSGSECQVTSSWLAAPGFFWNGQMWYLSNKGKFSHFRSNLFFNSFSAERCSSLGRARVWVYRGCHPHRLLLCCSHRALEQIKHCWGRLLQSHHFSEGL